MIKRKSRIKKITICLLIACIWSSNSVQTSYASESTYSVNHSAVQTDKITFAVIGDYGLAGQPELDVSNLVKSWNPDFIVTSGDNNQNDRPYEMDDNIGQYYHEYIYKYQGKYGEGSPTRRFFPSMGNHDWMGNGAKTYLDYFSLREYERYYEFIQGPVHFFMLDSDRKEPDGFTYKSQQGTWLRKALAASTSPFNVVVFHHAPYSSGKHGSSEWMQWPFKEWGADAVLSGNDHSYERLLVNGLPYFVNGLGGAELYKFETKLPESQIRYNLDYGAMRVEATSTYMKFQLFTRTNVLIDEYSIGQGNPTVRSITRLGKSITNANSLDFQVTFSETVTGVDVTDFLLTSTTTNASISAVNGSGNIYIVSAQTGSADGTLRLDLIDNDSIVNAFGNALGGTGAGNGNFITGEIYTIDKTPPSAASILRAHPNPTNSANVDFTLTFSEPVTGVDISDFTLTTTNPNGAFIIGVNGVGNLYNISVNTGSGDNTLRLDFTDNDSVIDAANNSTGGSGSGNGNYISGETYTVHKTTPNVLSIVRANPNPANLDNVDFIVTFSEFVTGVDTSDFNLTTSNINGAFINSVNGSGTIYTVSVYSGSGDGTLRVDLIDNDSIIGISGGILGNPGTGNGNFTNGETYSMDRTSPIVTSIIRGSPNPSSAANIDFIVTFSEPVSGIDTSDFILSAPNINNAFISNVNNVDPFYVVTVNTGAGTGTIRLDLVDDDSISDLAGNRIGGVGIGNGNFTNGEIYNIEKSFPAVTSIIRASTNPSNGSTVDFIVTFSESVSGVDASDFRLSTNNIINSSVRSVNNVDPFYIVTINTGIGTGTLGLELSDDDSIMNLAGSRLGGPGAGNGNFINSEIFSVVKNPVNFPAPSLREPKRNTLTNNPMIYFSWARVWDAQAYEIAIATDSNFAQVITSQVVNGLDFTSVFPLPDGVYHWRVRAYNPDLQPGKFSQSNSFTIDTTPPSAPLLLSPIDNITTGRKPKFEWEKLNAAKYQIEIDNNSDFSSPEWAALRNDASYQAAFMRKGTYFWRVRARDMAGNWGNWSTVFKFTYR